MCIRDRAKDHGIPRHVEGRASLPNGSKVCIVEDTCTSGGSLIRAVQLCEAEGLEVVQALTIVDRQEGAVERVKAETGLDLISLIARSELE